MSPKERERGQDKIRDPGKQLRGDQSRVGGCASECSLEILDILIA